MHDVELPDLDILLDVVEVGKLIEHDVRAATLVHHKAGRRAVIAYDTEVGMLFGKLRKGHRASRQFMLAESLRKAGLDGRNRIHVPEPIVAIDDRGFWLQRGAAGLTATQLLRTDPRCGNRVGTLAAEAAHAIHCAGVQARRSHSAHDELRVLVERLESLADTQPLLRIELGAIMGIAERVVNNMLAHRGVEATIHRDYYPDQLIVNGDEVTVVDFDLYCFGDPAVDIGNFLAHLQEQVLREPAHATQINEAARSCVERFLLLRCGKHSMSRRCEFAAVDAYRWLSLARHISLSAEREERAHLTGQLMSHCRTTNPLSEVR